MTNLRTGVTRIGGDAFWVPGQRGRYANSNFTTKSQMRAANGRIFFPADQCELFYYEPADGTVHDLGRVPGTVNDSLLYSLTFDHTGARLFGGTLAGTPAPGRRPSLVMIDPNTLAMTYLCQVGTDRTKNGYAQFIRVVGNSAWVIVGQEKYELVLVDIAAKTSTVMASDPSSVKFIHVAGVGLTAQIGGTNGPRYWLLDGAFVPYVAGVAPPGPAQDLAPYLNPLVNPPQIDDTGTPSVLRWRPYGSTGAWTDIQLPPVHGAPVPIESLTALPDGSVFGSVATYGGFFRVDPSGHVAASSLRSSITDAHGLFARGMLFLGGYPNGITYVFDPSAPISKDNPHELVRFSDSVSFSGLKRADVLGYSPARDRLYVGGTRDRNGYGGGIGYYDFASATAPLGGHFVGLNNFTEDICLAVLDYPGLVVFSGRIGDDPLDPAPAPTEAQLVIHNMDTNELERQTPIPGLQATRHLFECTDPNVVVGLADDIAYRWDVVNKRLLSAVSFGGIGVLGATCSGPAGIVTTMGTTLVVIDPDTLRITSLGTVPTVNRIAQSGADVYVAIGAQLGVFRGVL